jgi:hypothetical protein
MPRSLRPGQPRAKPRGIAQLSRVNRSAHVACVVVGAALVACGSGADRPTPTDSLLATYSQSGRADASMRSVGGVDVWAYCKSIGYPAVGYKRGYIEGPNAATDNWVCQRGTDQLKPIEPKLVDMNEACWVYHKRRDLIARPHDPNHAWSWDCYPTPKR